MLPARGGSAHGGPVGAADTLAERLQQLKGTALAAERCSPTSPAVRCPPPAGGAVPSPLPGGGAKGRDSRCCGVPASGRAEPSCAEGSRAEPSPARGAEPSQADYLCE